MFFKKTNYQRSNAIMQIDFPVSKIVKKLTKQLLGSQTENKRQRLGTRLFDELCDLAQIDVVNLKVSSAKQYHSKYKGKVVAKQYGYYRPQSSYIYVNNRTAVRGQILASKTFLDTILHEWTHHYDHHKLKLNSIHTSGFYARLKDLKEKLGYYDA